jgi:LacI family transcriptional regulator
VKITMKEIAKEIGVSVSTVSNAINGKKKTSEETHRMIMQAVEKYNYVPDSTAKNLRRQKTKTAALVVSSFPDLYVTRYINSVGIRAREMGYHLLFINTNENYEYEKETIQLLRSNMVDGIILSPTTSDIDYLNDLINQQFPIVLVNRYDPRLTNIPRVTADDYQAGYDATIHLIQHGHQKIGLVYSVPNVTTTIQRIEGYKAAMKEFNLSCKEEWIERGHATVDGGFNAVKSLMTRENDITALFVLSDFMTIGTVKALNSMSIRIPEDVALIGFGDFEAATIIDPPITNINLPPDTIGTTAFDLLLNRIHNPNYCRHISLPTSLITRKSCGC